MDHSNCYDMASAPLTASSGADTGTATWRHAVLHAAFRDRRVCRRQEQHVGSLLEAPVVRAPVESCTPGVLVFDVACCRSLLLNNWLSRVIAARSTSAGLLYVQGLRFQCYFALFLHVTIVYAL